ncbi:MAG: hypothetical protein IJR36_05560 [Lachnospiraceae bacterium]|nr:hypothetical protein [Lachnospiraceae bacterium]
MAMRASEALEMIIQSAKLKKRQVAARMGISPQALNGRMKQQGGLGTSAAAEIAKACVYKLVLVPANTKLKEGWFEVE